MKKPATVCPWPACGGSVVEPAGHQRTLEVVDVVDAQVEPLHGVPVPTTGSVAVVLATPSLTLVSVHGVTVAVAEALAEIDPDAVHPGRHVRGDVQRAAFCVAYPVWVMRLVRTSS